MPGWLVCLFWQLLCANMHRPPAAHPSTHPPTACLPAAGDHERNLAPAVVRHSMRDPGYHLPPLRSPLHLDVSAVALPHPEKAAAGQKGLNRKGFGYGGEDSYFYSTNR